MSTILKTSTWFLLFLLLAAACLDEPDCFSLNNDVIGISFKKLQDSSADTIIVSGVGTLEPPLLFARDTSFSRINLPLNYFEDETAFFFQTGEGSEILRLSYVSQAQFVSENCGEKFLLSKLRVVEHSFDSVRLVIDTPTSQGGTIHLEIFQ